MSIKKSNKRNSKVKFILALALASMWFLFSVWIAEEWILEVVNKTNYFFMVFALSGIAFIPGFIILFLYSSMLLDKRNKYNLNEVINTTVLIAAFNEESNILKPLEATESQIFNGELEVIVIDDGSSDKTSEVVSDFISNSRKHNYRLITLSENQGKSAALNAGLKESIYETIVTIDADTTFAKEDSLQRLVSSLNGKYKSVAGTVISRNPNKTCMTRLQEWDYLFGISIVKRIQSMYSGTLVCQGAFSAYRKDALLEVGGWKNVVGEDIVLTWDMLSKDYKTYHNTEAVALTETPENYKQFFQQRKRWSRGMIEAFRSNWKLLFKARLSTIFVWYNLFFPYIDFVFAFIFTPAIIGALFFGFYLLASSTTLLIIPLTLFFTTMLYIVQKKTMNSIGLKMSKNIIGMICYILFFQMIQTPATLSGYFSEFFRLKKTWGTKKSKSISILVAVLISSSAFSQENEAQIGGSKISDTDKNSASKLWLGYSKKENNFVWNLRVGNIFFEENKTLEKMSFLGGGITSEVNDWFSFDLSVEQVVSDWSPFLYDGKLEIDPIKKVHAEVLFSRGIVETISSLDNKVSFVSNGLTLDYSLIDDKLVVVGGYLNQQFTDNNTRHVYIGKLVWVVKDYFALNSTTKMLRISDYSQNYFSPKRFDTHTFGIHKYLSVFNDKVLIKPEAGYGFQYVEGMSKGFYFGKILIKGDLTKRTSLKFSTYYSNARSEYGTYGLFMGSIRLGYKF